MRAGCKGVPKALQSTLEVDDDIVDNLSNSVPLRSPCLQALHKRMWPSTFPGAVVGTASAIGMRKELYPRSLAPDDDGNFAMNLAAMTFPEMSPEELRWEDMTGRKGPWLLGTAYADGKAKLQVQNCE